MGYYSYSQGPEHCKNRIAPMASGTKQDKHCCACSPSHGSDNGPFMPTSVKEWVTLYWERDVMCTKTIMVQAETHEKIRNLKACPTS